MAQSKTQRLGVFTELGNSSRAIEGLKTTLREESIMEKCDVRISAKDLRVCFDQCVVKMGEELVSREAADRADDGFDFGVFERVMNLRTAEEDCLAEGLSGCFVEENLDSVT